MKIHHECVVVDAKRHPFGDAVGNTLAHETVSLLNRRPDPSGFTGPFRVRKQWRLVFGPFAVKMRTR